MQTIAPTHSAIGWYTSPVQPRPTNTRQVAISVAIVIPEIGFDDDPIRPTIRLATVTKKNPKIDDQQAEQQLAADRRRRARTAAPR